MAEQRSQLDNKPLHVGPSRLTKLSILESLPAEILQQIFLDSCNGNLLIAAPRVAVKISGSQGVNRAAFLIAFYNHQLREIARLIGVDYLVPTIDLPIQAWDVRSMTKAVLRSRWCACGWTKDFFFSLFSLVVRDSITLLRKGGSFMGEPILELSSLAVYAAKALSQQKARTDPTSLSPLSADHFNICLELLNLHEEDANSTGIDEESDTCHWRFNQQYSSLYETVFRQVNWKSCGCVTMQSLILNRYGVNTAFREIVFDLLKKKSFDKSKREDFSIFQDRMLGPVYFSKTFYFGECPLREFLAIDYFFHPEDDIFRISPSFYRAAAAKDLLEGPSDNGYNRVHFLFEIDLFNLPKTDEYILAWARETYQPLRHAVTKLAGNRHHFKGLGGEGKFSLKAYGRLLKYDVREAYGRVTDRYILQYLSGGYIESGKRRFWPNFDCNHLNESISAVIENDNIADKAEHYRSRLQKPQFPRGRFDQSHVLHPSAERDGYILRSGYIPGAEHSDTFYWSLAQSLFQTEDHSDLNSIDWTATVDVMTKRASIFLRMIMLHRIFASKCRSGGMTRSPNNDLEDHHSGV